MPFLLFFLIDITITWLLVTPLEVGTCLFSADGFEIGLDGRGV